MGTRVAMSVAGAGSLSRGTAVVLRVLLYPEILGTAVLWVAMWYFWFSFDSSHFLKKAAWFLLLIIMGPLSLPFYYFFVYRRWASRIEPQEPAASPATR